MSGCEHETNYYVEDDAPVVFSPDDSVKYVTYRCTKCKQRIYREKPWEKWKLAK